MNNLIRLGKKSMSRFGDCEPGESLTDKSKRRPENLFALKTGTNPVGLWDEFVGESSQMREVKRLIALVAPSTAPVLILGETGTGKEVVARIIHEASERAPGPFIAVNAGALPEHIVESELFGYKKGAFTGAQSDKAGLLDVADKGTFFADEVGDMDVITQAKLLRVVETGVFRRLGDTKERQVNVRVVSATNKDLEEEVERKNFRADLFYRLSTFLIHIPPLRQRREDIPLLVAHLLRRISRGDLLRVSPGALRLLMNYSWPGNVRQLSNTLERACLFAGGDGVIEADDLPLGILNNEPLLKREKEETKGVLLVDAEREHIRRILEASKGNKTLAARILGISRSTLYRLVEER